MTEAGNHEKTVFHADQSLPSLLTATIPAAESAPNNELPAFRTSFAFDLLRVRRQTDPNRVLFGWAALLSNLRNAEEIAVARCGLDLRQWLRVRLTGARGMVSLSIVGQTEGGEQWSVEESAKSLAVTIADSLGGMGFAYRFAPSITEAHSAHWGALPDAAQAMAVVRRESSMTVEGKPIYLRHDVFRTSTASDLLGLLTMREHPTVIDLSIAPTRITPDERKAASESVSMWSEGLSESIDDDPLQRMLRSQQMTEDLNGARSRLRGFMDQSHDGLFEVRVQLLTSGTTDLLPLANRVGVALFGPMKHEVVPLTLVQADGADILRLPRREKWAHSMAGVSLRRMRDVFTAAEAIVVTCPPIPDTSGLPGIRLDAAKFAPLLTIQNEPGIAMGKAASRDGLNLHTVTMADTLRSRHAYFAGRTGTGKSTLLVNLALQDIEKGRGVAFIDPHGDAVTDLLERIPPERAGDVIYFDMTDGQRPIGFNIMAATDPQEQDLVIREFMGLMFRLFDPNRLGIVGPRWEQAVSTAMRAAFYLKDPTLNEVLRIISDLDYARQVFKFVTDPVAREIFNRVILRMSDYHRSEILDYITSKFVRFLLNVRVRNVVSQTHFTLDLPAVMRERKILLVNLAKGVIGPETSQFIGLLLLPQILIAALARARLPRDQRPMFCLYVDEFHTFETQALASALAEGRKYGLSLILANQYTSQIDRGTLQAITGNVGTMGSFRVGLEDAPIIAQEMMPVFNAEELLNLPSFQVALKLADGAEPSVPFLLYTQPLIRPADPTQALQIAEQSRARYGVDAAEITAQIDRRYTQSPVPAKPMPEPAKPDKRASVDLGELPFDHNPFGVSRADDSDQDAKSPIQTLEEMLRQSRSVNNPPASADIDDDGTDPD